MEITRETDYAIRCVLYLSRKNGDVTMVDEISREMNIPRSFLAKIVQKLTKSGLVISYRGVKGGFQLAKKPEDISLLDVIAAIQGPVAMNICAVNKEACGFSCTCTVHPVWVDLRAIVEDYLRKTDFNKLSGSLLKLRTRNTKGKKTP